MTREELTKIRKVYIDARYMGFDVVTLPIDLVGKLLSEYNCIDSWLEIKKRTREKVVWESFDI